ncbi:MAG: AAA family ATPase, partial [Chloroflexota bacterium]
MNSLPEGTLTFLLTDLEGSTRAWEANPAAMRAAMEQHDALVQAAVAAHSGMQVEAGREGDSVLAVFRQASAAATCALALQRSLGTATWPGGLDLRVRIALHTGEAQLRGAHYFGQALNRCARLLALGHGGQVLLSTATRELLADELPPRAAVRDLGPHRLKDLTRPERVFELADLDRPGEFPPLRSGRAQGNNLPLQLTTFVGRGAELEELDRLQEEARLLTITGPGGVGKTRLAVELAGRLAERPDGAADGVWFVELAGISDPGVVPRAVATALDLEEQAGRAVEETLAAHCAERELVLVLDNCEHLVDRCAALAEQLLRAAPGLRVIATSREPLRVPGEVAWRVPALAATEARRLFAERTPTGSPGLEAADAEAGPVARICARLDGMPLAIELAAAQLAMMPVEEVATRIESGLPLAGTGSRTALPRQQTLEALIEWSHRLLDAEEGVLFRRLSVFAGDFSLAAAEAVGAASGLAPARVVPVLSELVAKSLLQPSEGRYRYLETIRAFAGARLQAAGEADAVRERHARYYAGLAAGWTPGERAAWLDRMEADHENLRAALGWAEARDPALAAGLGSSLYDFWYLRGYVSEGRDYLGRFLAALPPAADGRRHTLLDAAGLAYVAGDLESAEQLLDEGLEVAR